MLTLSWNAPQICEWVRKPVRHPVHLLLGFALQDGRSKEGSSLRHVVLLTRHRLQHDHHGDVLHRYRIDGECHHPEIQSRYEAK